jgi:hypothetical protein
MTERVISANALPQGNFIISIIYNYHIIIQYRANYPILYNIPKFML